MALLIGTSGWSYDSWRHLFFAGVPQRRWFEHTMAGFRTVELNVSFYRLPPASTFAGWARRSPDDAIVTVKASRYLTHIKRLRDPEEPVARLMGRARELGSKLGPVLVQLPPDLRVDVDALRGLLDAFGPGQRIALETRHESWWCDEVRALLEEHGAAHVWADRKGRALGPTWRTAGFGYVRFHHGDRGTGWRYRDATLRRWAEQVAGTYGDGEDVFAYFNNDPEGAAIEDAVTFGEIALCCGLTPTRTPGRPTARG